MALTLYVADLSNNNAGPIDFVAMRQGGAAAVILKVSEGTGFLDPTFIPRARAAHAAGLAVVGYHFFRPDQDPLAQARLFLAGCAAAGVPVAFRVADVEVGPAPVQGAADRFIAAAGVTLLYSGAWFAGAYLSGPVAGVLWWLAAYGQPTPPAPPWGRLAGWQFAMAAHVPGVPGPCDLSIFDPAAWAELTGGDVPQPDDVTSAFVPPTGHPDAGSGWDVTWSGAVITRFGGRFYGSFFSLPPQQGVRNFVGITARPDGRAGYVLHGNDGSYYAFGPASAVGEPALVTAGPGEHLACEAVDAEGRTFTFTALQPAA